MKAYIIVLSALFSIPAFGNPMSDAACRASARNCPALSQYFNQISIAAENSNVFESFNWFEAERAFSNEKFIQLMEDGACISITNTETIVASVSQMGSRVRGTQNSMSNTAQNNLMGLFGIQGIYSCSETVANGTISTESHYFRNLANTYSLRLDLASK